ncbi:ArsR/SmtB family transcription factor [Lentzea nigeriaca]|uniref:ArsR/SmtB family transcription factor n=1 Tax=Lentzea nigeriaca TaxID=1128665 RepID=UPI00195A2EDF|nr:helix-turn-helix domain-containing protein [Lentzea nigeriaca]MBM7860073.1 DNA-binding transcriptional ArsR family regulator [Lentzea nigeriaca]
MKSDPDIARAAALLADGSRARMLKALCNGQAITATALADEAGVSGPTASVHLAKLVEAGLVTAHREGRNRRYRLSRPEVADALEALAAIAPPLPVTSLRQSVRTDALRRSRTCYDHLAGRLGVQLMGALLDTGVLTGGDGRHHPDTAVHDRLAAYGRDQHYELSEQGAVTLRSLGVDVREPGRRPLIRYCVDWSEERHHLSGALGAAIANRLFALGWLKHGASPRVVHLTDAGESGLAEAFGRSFADVRPA